MIRINLLPHREMKRRMLLRQFQFLMGGAVVLGAAIVLLVHTLIVGDIEHQESRNRYLEEETKKLDKQIEEIKELKEKVRLMVARKQVVESLQVNRSHETRLLDLFARILPPGIYLSSLEEKGDKLIIKGYTESSARVSTLMRAIEGSGFLGDPQLIEIKAVSVNKNRVNQFELHAKTRAEQGPKDDKKKK